MFRYEDLKKDFTQVMAKEFWEEVKKDKLICKMTYNVNAQEDYYILKATKQTKTTKQTKPKGSKT